MAISFTSEQQRVIDLHKCNILVSAAAGSGKTAVLVERIIQMICNEVEPVDIDRLLIVTFTNAAASEMRERIAKGIAERLQQNPESLHIQRQATLLHNALITTIDSFSLFLIRNHFNEIGLDPAFRVADEGEMKLLSQEVLADLMEDEFASDSEPFRRCVEYFCPAGHERVLEEHILNLSRYASTFPWPTEWLEQRKKDYVTECVEELVDSDYGSYLLSHLKKFSQGCRDKMDRAKCLCETADGPYMYGEIIEKELKQLEELCDCNSLEIFEGKLQGITFGRLSTKKDESVSPLKRELVKDIRAMVKKCLEDLNAKLFATSLELSVKQGRECVQPICTLIDLVLAFDERIREKKKEKKIINFSDMEHYALDILLVHDEDSVRPSQVAKEYREYFQEILIDEYQDSNLVQEYLLKAVSKEEDGVFNRFMVGDVKQSIYKFRLARPELFLDKYYRYDGEQGLKRRIDLSKNFRSREEVITTVNDIFAQIMSEEIGGIIYDDAAALHIGAIYPENKGCESELLLVEKPGKDVDINAKEAEAFMIAQKIKDMRATFLVTDKESKELRPAEYRDMVILLRSNAGWDDVFKHILEKEGIPCYITSKTGYFSAHEVQELLQFLRVLDNPRQDIPLFGTMKSHFGEFTEEEIAFIRASEQDVTLYEAIEKYVENCEDACTQDFLQEKSKRFLEQIHHYRSLTVYLSIRELLQQIVDDFDYLNYVTALPGGSRRRANVEMLFTKASSFESTSYSGVFHFVRYMEQLEKYDVDYGEAGVMDENANVVRIMSIHKSKGLEFPIIFVSGLAKRFNMQDTQKSLIVDMDMGMAVDYVNSDRRVRNSTLRKQILSRKMREENLAEELRVLYVALTRAKEKLIMTGACTKAEERWEAQKELGAERLSYVDFVDAGSYLDFILPVLPKDSVKVTIYDIQDLMHGELVEEVEHYVGREQLTHAEQFADPKLLKRLQESFSYQYPYRNLEGLYTKTTVSELKIAAMEEHAEAAFHQFEEKEVETYIPLFKRGEEKISGSLRGSAFHRVMELLDFEYIYADVFTECDLNLPSNYEEFSRFAEKNREQLAQQLHQFLLDESKKRLSEEYFQIVDEKKILNFLCTRTAFRMWAAERREELYREQPFVYGISAKRLSETFPEDEKVLIQGIIDVFFIEDGKLIVLDYKTDAVETMEDLWNRYSTQLEYYAEALEKLLVLPVTEKLLYSFRLEQEDMKSKRL